MQFFVCLATQKSSKCTSMKICLGKIGRAGLLAVILIMTEPTTTVADPNHMTNDAIQAFWSGCQGKVISTPASDFFRVRHFGQDTRVADLLAGLIAAGEKTGMFTSPWIFEGKPNETPMVGGYTVVTNFLAEPRLLLRTTAVSTMRFDEISEKETSVDGPAVRNLHVWRRVHWAYLGRELAKLDRKPSQDMPITIEKFEVVCDYKTINSDP